MATRKTVAEVYEELDARITHLEKMVHQLASKPHKTRKVREYTAEEKAAIRERLLKGQEAARKKREDNAEATKKVKADASDKAKPAETDKPAKV
jgi:anthranilate phosphoribosyltransferase